jgi:hypothetical protein
LEIYMMFFKGPLNWFLVAMLPISWIFNWHGYFHISAFLLLFRSNVVWWPLRMIYGHPMPLQHRSQQDIPTHRYW